MTRKRVNKNYKPDSFMTVDDLDAIINNQDPTKSTLVGRIKFLTQNPGNF